MKCTEAGAARDLYKSPKILKTLDDINDFFGDADLFLIDAILKGDIPSSGRVLDVGCGSGRNAIYFINQGYEYHGLDVSASQVSVCKALYEGHPKVRFGTGELQNLHLEEKFDFILCSRVLHFAEGEEVFFKMLQNLKAHLKPEGILYLTMDAVIDTEMGEEISPPLTLFPDGAERFALNEKRYGAIKELFKELQPLRTVVHHGQRAESVMLLRHA